MDNYSFSRWIKEPQQIFFLSFFVFIICIIITKISKRRRSKHKDFHVRDPRIGHHWVYADFFVKPSYCNICETSIVHGMFCDTCFVCVHDECEEDGNKKLACKVMSLSERSSMRHHWIKGNLALCSNCKVCNLPCGVEPRLCDYRCVWCQFTVHEGKCYGDIHDSLCTFGENQNKILPPYCVTLKTVGWKGRKRVVIKDVKKPNFDKWQPILVIANPKSGGNEGEKLLRVFRLLLNPAQVIDLSETSLETALEFCCLLPDVQCRILICGGDGTVGWVLDSLDKVDVPIKPLIGIHPLGTGNDLAKVLGWGKKYVGDEHEIDELMKDFEEAEPTLFDRWKVRIQNTGYFDKKPPSKVLSMNSYVSVGCDAQVVLNFHRHRETQPSLFSSRFINKLMYFIYGSRDVLGPQCKDLHKRVDLELDGCKVTLPELEGIVVLNINSWCGGCQLWNNNDEEHPSSFNDGYLEVMGLYSALHIAKLQVNLAEPMKLGRAKTVKITVHKTKEVKNVPMQLDGEPWEQGPCVVTVNYQGQVSMLKNQYDET